MDEQKGCQFCYYEYFDGKAYPCSMCIRGEERTDKFEPKGRQTKQTDCNKKCGECWNMYTCEDSTEQTDRL